MKEKEALQHAMERFKDHVATYCDYGNVATLTWAKSGTIDYSMRFVFDREGHTVTISGDLGHAVLRPTCKCDLEHCAKAFGSSIDYFTEKIRTSTDMFIYDEKEAEAELRVNLLGEGLTLEERAERELLISTIMEDFSRDTGVREMDDDTSNWLNRVSPDAFEWIGSIGRQYHRNVYLWMYAIQMAWEQVSQNRIKESDQPEIHVVIGMTTGHISPKTEEYLEKCVDIPIGPATFRKEDVTGKHGWWVACFEEPDEDIPNDLRECIRFAQKHGADWIMFDGDATSYKELSVYDGHGGEWMGANIVPGTYVSVWDSGVEVKSVCKVHDVTREVVSIEPASVDGLDYFDHEYVLIEGVEHPVLDHKPETEEEWAELRRKDGYWRD